MTVTGLEGGHNGIVGGFSCGDGIDAEAELRETASLKTTNAITVVATISRLPRSDALDDVP
jgi:hypothetical protein